jgi:hypothetical protein
LDQVDPGTWETGPELFPIRDNEPLVETKEAIL